MTFRPARLSGRRGVAIGLLAVLVIGLARVSAGDESHAEPPNAAASLADSHRGFSLLPGRALDPSLSGRDFALLADDAAAEAQTPPGRDWVGLGRDTALLLGYHLAAIGFLYVLPEEITNWSQEEKDRGFSKWADNVTSPTFDKDNWFLNYVMHPYFGATYYIRARERGFDWLSSFAYSALASTLYEFGLEAIYEQPSIQDLIVTPIGGALLGAFVFEPIRAMIKAKPQLEWYDHVGLVLTDPIGALNYVVERMLGIKSTIRVNLKLPVVVQDERPRDRQGQRAQAFGLEVTIPWP